MQEATKLADATQRNLKQIFKSWSSFTHTWLGLIFGVGFVFMGLSGAVLSIRPELERAFFPSESPRIICQGDGSLAALSAAVPSFQQPLDRLYFSNNEDPRVLLRFLNQPLNAPKGEDRSYSFQVYSSCTGRLMGTAPLAWMEWIIDLHHNLLAGKTGRKATGIFGIFLLLNSLTGLALWLMIRPKLSHIWAWPPRVNWQSRSFLTHRSAGLLAMAFLLLQAGTGYFYAFPLEEGGPRQKIKKSTAPLLPLDRYIDSARALRPGLRVHEVRLAATGGHVSVEFWLPPGQWPAGDSTVLLNRADATLLQASHKPFMTRVAWLHLSEWAGAPSRYAAAFLGLTPLFLFITGILIWALRRAAASRRSRKVLAQTTTTISSNHPERVGAL